MLSVKTFSGPQTGPHILILGGIHGNERCGVIALSHLSFELEQKIVTIQSGQVTIAPLCNPVAYQKNQRLIEHNLNRIISRYEAPSCIEEQFADEVAQLIERADIVLDLHSYSAGNQPYIFLDKPSPDNIALAEAQGIEYWIMGWDKIYGQPELNTEPTDTIQYAFRKGKTATFVECGQHDNPTSTTIAYRCARRTLAHYGVVAYDDKMPPSTPKLICVERIIRHEKEGHFVQDWVNFDTFKKGEPLIKYKDKSFELAPYDGTVILPDAHAPMGHEWLYLGQPTDKY